MNVRIRIPQERRVFVTSDLHLNHRAVIKYGERPFKNVGEMNSRLLELYNDTVNDNDIVYFIGDVLFYRGKNSIEILKEFKGDKRLVAGNHDFQHLRHLIHYFNEVNTYREIKYRGNDIVMMHFPLASWNKGHYGSYHLHGHIHSTREANMARTDRRYDVGVEANDYRPVLLDDIIDLLSTRSVARNHHDWYRLCYAQSFFAIIKIKLKEFK